MSAIHQVVTYSFDELDERAQERAAQHISDALIQDADLFYVVDQWAEDLAAQGVTVNRKRTCWSVSWSQSDGASFAADVDLAAWMRSQKIAGKYRTLYNAALAEEAWAGIELSRYSDVGRPLATVDAAYADTREVQARLDAQIETVQEALEEWAAEKAHDLYRSLRDELESYWDREYVREEALANEWEFYENGEMYP